MFIISKRNFLVRRADGSSFLIKKDFVGEVPQDVYESGIIQGAIKGGFVATPETHKDKDIEKAGEKAEKAEEKGDIRPDTETSKKTSKK